MVTSSVSPERCEMIVPNPASRAISMARSVSVSVPIWLGLIRMALPMPSSMPRFRIPVLVTNRSWISQANQLFVIAG